jgi:hypothetical protein
LTFDIQSLQAKKSEQLMQKHLFQQDVFAERFQTKFDQETITSEVLNQRFDDDFTLQHALIHHLAG